MLRAFSHYLMTGIVALSQNPVVAVFPRPLIAAGIFAIVLLAIVATIGILLSVDDPVKLKALIEDSGPVQTTGLVCVALAFACALFYSIFDVQRRGAYLMLSYLLMFYTLREADFHYKLSPYAKATQFKRFFGHELIPLSSKLFLAAIVALFLFTLYRYLRDQKQAYLQALRLHTPWAWYALAWAGIFVLSQMVDQVPLFHNERGQVFEEVFEASAEALALLAMILFRVQVAGERRLNRY